MVNPSDREGIGMAQIRLIGLLASLALLFILFSNTRRSHSHGSLSGETVPFLFDSGEIIWDGSVHRAKLFPHFADFDADGKIDMLVGVGDRLSVHRNVGTNSRPVYAEPTWFDETEPSARIPYG